MQHLNLTPLIRKLNPSEFPSPWIQQTRPTHPFASLRLGSPSPASSKSQYSPGSKRLNAPLPTYHKDPKCPQIAYLLALRKINLLWGRPFCVRENVFSIS